MKGRGGLASATLVEPPPPKVGPRFRSRSDEATPLNRYADLDLLL